MTQQSQQLWSVIENILLIINKLWRQQHGRAVKRGYWSNWWMELGGKEKDKWQHPQTLPKLQVATSLYLGS
jgi:hypothetical protein